MHNFFTNIYVNILLLLMSQSIIHYLTKRIKIQT